MEITLIKNLNGYFIPAYDSDKEIANKIKVGDPITGKFRKLRNYEFHKKYFALLNLAFSNQENFKVFEDFRKEVIKRAGYYKEVVNFKGNVDYIPLSISFAKMDEIEFQNLYNKTIDVIIMYVLKDNTKQEIEEQIINFM